MSFKLIWETRTKAAASLLLSLDAERGRMREALKFYADISKYPAPLTGGMGELWSDCGQVARSALPAAMTDTKTS